jgi:hypothetical protein
MFITDFRKAVLLFGAAAALGLTAAGFAAQTQPSQAKQAPVLKKKYTTARLNPHPPVIDGKLDAEVWDKVPWEGGFVQRQPYEGREPSEKTAFKILYDDKNVYVFVRAYDSQPDKVERRMARRDQAGGDTIDVALDSLFDHLTAYVFTVNAAGVKADQLLANDGVSMGGEEDMSWDPIWDAAAATERSTTGSETRTSTSANSARTSFCAGNTSPARRCTSSGRREGRALSRMGRSTLAGTSAASSTSTPTTSSS